MFSINYIYSSNNPNYHCRSINHKIEGPLTRIRLKSLMTM